MNTSTHGPVATTFDRQRDSAAEPSSESMTSRAASVAEEEALRSAFAVLVAAIAETQEIDQAAIESESTLSEFGFDSITLAELSRRILAALPGVRLEPTVYLEHPSLRDLAEFLARQLPTTEVRSAPVTSVQDSGGDPPAHRARPVPSEHCARAASDAIALVGMAARVPGAESLVELWGNLLAGKSEIGDVPADRWDWRAFAGDPFRESGKTDCHRGAFLTDIARFDAARFGIARAEAELMDPQQRLLLEVAWEALEDAGHTRSELSGERVGVFIGADKYDYAKVIEEAQRQLEGYANTGVSHAMLANRLSSHFGWRGPSLALDSGCSSSLAAIWQAVCQLRQGHCDYALAGGVNLMLTPALFIVNRKLRMLTSDAEMRPFDLSSTGHINGEAAGLLVLRRLSDAVADGDFIHAIIRGAALEHGGRAAYLTAPNPASHRSVIEAALDDARLAVDDIDYLEAQGSGDPTTDRLELKVYNGLFGAQRAQPLRVGTLKGNLGHLGAASGVLATIKTALALRTGKLPKIPTLRQLNWAEENDGPFAPHLLTETEDWPIRSSATGNPRRAGVHNFGYGGVNVHLVMEAHAEAAQALSDGPAVTTLSASTPEALRADAGRLARYLRAAEYRQRGIAEPRLVDLAFASRGRDALEHRLALVAGDVNQLTAMLETYAAGRLPARGAYEGIARRSRADAKAVQQIELVNEDETKGLLERAARGWTLGERVDWQALDDLNVTPRRVPLPPRLRAGEHYWAKALQDGERERSDPPASPLILDWLLRLFAKTKGDVPADVLDADAPFDELGVSSLLIARMNVALGEHFPMLSKTLFYEQRTLRAIAEHLTIAHGAGVAALGAALASRTEPPQPAQQPRSPSPDAGAAEVREPIAVVGMSGRFPEADSLEALWENLKSGRDCIGEIPSTRWKLDAFFEPDRERAALERKSYAKWGGFLSGIDEFDALLFGISPYEAANLDPQERLFLQCCHAAIEDAGYSKAELAARCARRVGVFVGVTKTGYELYGPDGWRVGDPCFPRTSFSSMANRVSHWLDLQGPSMPVDTMCSSSLTAIHEACEQLLRGDCEMAIAGGVNLYTHPSSFVELSRLGMLAADGRCKSFGAGGSGFVPGEGVAALVLKPLSRALRDGDNIVALIRGTSINHGGRTHGYTVPNPTAQAQVIRQALDKARVSAGAVTYIEAHGTGTELGDPIEMSGLTQAFRADTGDVGYCALGSIKPNIGHLEGAAGVAGVIKVILQLRHAQLVPSLYCESPNPNIDFTQTPFRLQTALAPWPRPVSSRDDGEREQPRVAGVSSFGAAGANAHVVLEEYAAGAPLCASERSRGPVLIVLSAKDRSALHRRVEQLRAALAAGRYSESDLDDIAYTLQVGRDEFEQRLATVVESLAELTAKLGRALQEAESGSLWLGRANRARALVPRVHEAEDRSREAYEALARAWVGGERIAWSSLHTGAARRRLPLPTYPFERTRHWVIAQAQSQLAPVRAGGGQLREELCAMREAQLRYAIELTCEHLLVREHLLDGQAVLSAAGFLALVRSALLRTSRSEERYGLGLEFQDVEWEAALALAPGTSRTAYVELTALGASGFRFEISSAEGSERVVHCRGTAHPAQPAEDGKCDLTELRAQCAQQTLEGSRCYQALSALGVQYDPSAQNVRTVRLGQDALIAELHASPADESQATEPGLRALSAALQACAAFALRTGAGASDLRLTYPVRVDNLRSTPRGHADAALHLKLTHDTSDAQRFDLTVYDVTGTVSAAASGLLLRAQRPFRQALSPDPAPARELLLAPLWERVQEARAAAAPEHGEAGSWLVVGDSEASLRVREALSPSVRMRALASASRELLAQATAELDALPRIVWSAREPGAEDAPVLELFAFTRDLLALGYEERPLELVVVTRAAVALTREQPIDASQAALHGFCGSLAKEYPRWSIRVIDVEPAADWPLLEASRFPLESGEPLVARAGEWYRRQLVPAQWSESLRDASIYRTSATYVVIGGHGGIGRIWTAWVAAQHGAQVVWLGRRPQDEQIAAAASEIAECGPEPTYLQADARDRSALRAALDEVRRRYGSIRGVIHAAVGALDQSIASMSVERFREVLSAKITIASNLRDACAEDELDFMLFFSSVASFTAEHGKAAYTAGSAFVDALALSSARRLPYPVKTVNWGYWGEVGIGSAVPQVFKNRLRRTGVLALEPAVAMRELERLLTSEVEQIAIVSVEDPQLFTREDVALELAIPARVAVQMPVSVAYASTTDAAERAARTTSGDVEQMEELLADLLLRQLDALGVLDAQREPAPVVAQYGRWLSASVELMQARGWVVHTQRGSAALSDAGRARLRDPSAGHAQSLRSFSGAAEWRAHYELAAQTVENLGSILLGERSAHEVMFPDSSARLVEPVYKENSVSRLFHGLMTDVCAAHLADRVRSDPQALLRVLEVGAGTGGTSDCLVGALAHHAQNLAEYCISDVSQAFLHDARQRYMQCELPLRYALLDVQRPAAGQGVSGFYDIIVADNVLHAVEDVRNALRNLKAVMRPGALLVIGDLSKNTLFAHMTFGLLSGWWAYRDRALRTASGPALSDHAWRRALEQEGFRGIGFPRAETHALGQQIVVARSDGIVRRQRASERSSRPLQGAPTAHQSLEQAPEPARLRQRFAAQLRELVAGKLKLPPQKLELDEPLESYGLDSIIVVQINAALREHFGKALRSSLFFEHKTLAMIAEHLLKQDPTRARAMCGDEPRAEMSSKQVEVEADARAVVRPVVQRTMEAGSGRPVGARDPIGPVAIIGMSARFPHAPDVDAYFQLLAEGKSAIVEVPRDRWSLEGFYEPDRKRAAEHGRSYSKWGGFIDGAAEFDPLFFGISFQEAANLNPQERLFLQCCWGALEDAGYTRARLIEQHGRRVGVYAGVTRNGYELYGPELWRNGQLSFPHTCFSAVANRVSYFLDLHGPSMPVDTMCSSSLVAVHEACEQLRRGACELALVGGVNLHLHPSSYVAFSAQQMLSSDGACRSFGEGGDGFVPGEGVGVVVLKPLASAERDGDDIRAVILGSAVNHGGRTRGFTVPNPAAQRAVIEEALACAGVAARELSYLEAHGTGTELGDPIEVAAVSDAFARSTDALGFCALGSAKSNLGHLEAAAGVAGLIKVVLQLRHRTLVPTLHVERVNPNIDFAQTPLLPQRERRAWERPRIARDGGTYEVPRTAGVSSFGAGGSNAHVVVREYERPNPVARRASERELILLSARDEARLGERIQQLRDALEAGHYRDHDLPEIAYTLQCGREHMEQRVGFVVHDLAQLQACLAQAGRGGRVAGRSAASEQSPLVERALAESDLDTLLTLWLDGVEIAWKRLAREREARCIPLPTYPFARIRCWAGPDLDSPDSARERLPVHPLLADAQLHDGGLSWSLSLVADDFFIRDHRVKGRLLVPAVAQLELVRAGFAAAKLQREEAQDMWQLRNVAWSSPLAVEGPNRAVRLSFTPTGEASFEYELANDATDEPSVVFSQGSITRMQSARPLVDLPALRSSCTGREISGEQLYALLAEADLDYGPGQRAVVGLQLGRDEVLARLALPAVVLEGADAFALHPSLMDGALQAAVGLVLADGDLPSELPLPFAVREVQHYGPTPRTGWAHVRYGQGSLRTPSAVVNLDIDVMDERGFVAVRLLGLASLQRTSQPQLRANVPAALPTSEQTCAFVPRWRPVFAAAGGTSQGYERKRLVVYRSAPADAFRAEARDAQARSLRLGQADEAGRDFESFAVSLLAEAKEAARCSRERYLLQVVVPSVREGSLSVGVSGLLQTLRLEQPTVTAQLIEISSEVPSERLPEVASSAERLCQYDWLRSEDGQLLARTWQSQPTGHAHVPWRAQGVYLVSGGAGALALQFAREIGHRAPSARVVLMGRSALEPSDIEAHERLRAAGAHVHYERVDVTQSEQVQSCVRQVLERFGRIDGVLHAAGVVQDRLLFHKSEAELRAVLAPKVKGALNLDEATASLPLDFFVSFASVAGALGNVGQADYATANAWLDAFAAWRSAQVKAGLRRGRSLAIDWPLWRDGRMRADEETLARLHAERGVTPISTAAGLRAFYDAFGSEETQIMILDNEAAKQLRQDDESSLAERPSASAARSSVEESPALEPLIRQLRATLARIAGTPVELADIDRPLTDFGIDSVKAVRITRELEVQHGSLSKTLFFEYRNLREIANYLALQRAYRAEPVRTTHASTRAEGEGARRTEPPAPQVASVDVAPQAGDIAIVGLSGRYPGAPHARAFWKNLRAGVDSIQEIPTERWEHSKATRARADTRNLGLESGGFLDDVAGFDAQFFNISPREASYLDPQERLFLQCAYATLEDAGYTPSSLAAVEEPQAGANVGVFVGVMYEEYQLYGAELSAAGRPLALSGNPASIANRVSYFCDFTGPSMAVDTMCSSSLTSIHLACASLRDGECDAALAGGVNLSIHPNKYQMLGQGRFASSSGRCESFGAGGDGYVPSEGVGAVLLKPLARAIADNDHIYGIIRGSAINHGGRTNGYTVPNAQAQARVISRALTRAKVQPRSISYVEAHGTGTSLGDPIEIAGLTRAFRAHTQDEQFCAIGSVKSNIGHCEGAAGIAALSKVLLQLQHGELVPSLHSKETNPNIDFPRSPFFVQKSVSDWVRPKLMVDGSEREFPRIAAISSFGAGGANAHLVIEEYVTSASVDVQERGPALVVLSARTEQALRDRARELVEFIEHDAPRTLTLRDVAYTLQVGRVALDERLALVVHSLQELAERLRGFGERAEAGDVVRAQARAGRDLLGAFASDPDVQAAVEQWARRGDYERLASVWVKGFDVDFAKLYRGAKPRRVPLPSYPFARDRYWVPGAELDVRAPSASPRGEQASAYVEPMAHAPFVAAASPAGAGVEPTAKAARIRLRELSEAAPQPEVKLQQPSASARTLQEAGAPEPAADAPRELRTAAGSDRARAGGESGGQATPTLPTLDELHELLLTTVADALYLRREEVDPDRKFVELGMDSIVGVEWTKKINVQFGTSIPATRVYDHPTVRDFARYLLTELGRLRTKAVESRSEPSEQPLDALLRSVKRGELDAQRAEKLLANLTNRRSHGAQNGKSEVRV